MNLRDKLKLMLLKQADKRKKPIWLPWLESDGNQYCGTGIKDFYYDEQSANVTISISKASDKFVGVFGAREDFSQNLAQNIFLNGYSFRIDWLNAGQSKHYAINERLTFSFNAKKGSITTETGDKASFVKLKGDKLHEICPREFLLFTFNDLGEIYSSGGFYGKIYSCQLYDKGVLVRNMRPCLHPETFRPAMYDTVEGKYYYNEGVGEFKYDLSFVELDYIQGNGKQYIDTGILPNEKFTTLKTEFKVDRLEVAYTALLGSRVGSGEESWNLFVARGNPPYIRVDIVNQQQVSFNETGWNTLLANCGGTSINGQTVSKPVVTDVDYSHTIYLFNFNTNGFLWATGFSGAMKDVVIDRSGFLQRDMIPVRMNDGQIGMWDFVTGAFFGNKGTGNFKGYIGDNQVGTLQVQAAQFIDSGFISTIDSQIQMTFELDKESLATGFTCLFGRNGYSGDGDIRAFLSSSVIYYGIGEYRKEMKVATKKETLYNFFYDKSGGYYNDIILEPAGKQMAFQQKTTLLFSDNKNGSFHLDGKCYSASLINKEMACIFVPIKTALGKIGMLDVVSGKMYENAGTGEFGFVE